jgi:serine/threonine-protein phosphatase 2B regulatory subunit
MGSDESMSWDAVSGLAQEHPFTREDWMVMTAKFNALDYDGNYQIHPSEFRTIPEVADNQLLDYLIAGLDQDGNGQIDFHEFCTGMSLFASDASREDKTAFLFRMLDADRDGFLSYDDLFGITKRLSSDHLSDSQIRDLVWQQIAHNDIDGDGRLSLDEFSAKIARSGLARLGPGAEDEDAQK